MAQAQLAVPTASAEAFRRFPNVGRRNFLHGTIEVPTIVRLFGLPRGKRMLEVGCGRGVALPVFARMLEPARLVGLDIDAALLDEAEARLDALGARAELRHGDVREIPFADGSFDIVVDFGTCYHIARPEDALREIERVLAPNGWFVYETKLSQVLGHPVRSRGRRMPWHTTRRFGRVREVGMWGMRRKAALATWNGTPHLPLHVSKDRPRR